MVLKFDFPLHRETIIILWTLSGMVYAFFQYGDKESENDDW